MLILLDRTLDLSISLHHAWHYQVSRMPIPHHGALAGLQRGANKTPNGTGPDSSEAQKKTTARRRVAATILFASQALLDDLLCMKLNKAPSPFFPHPLTHTRASDTSGPGSLPSPASPLWEAQKGAHRVRRRRP